MTTDGEPVLQTHGQWCAAVHVGERQSHDPTDLAPGRLRGYVRASFADLERTVEAPDFWAVQAQLATLPTVMETARLDYADWETRLSADGLPSEVVRLVLLATTGADLLGTVDVPLGATNAQIRDGLLRLTHSPDAVAALLAGTA